MTCSVTGHGPVSARVVAKKDSVARLGFGRSSAEPATYVMREGKLP